MSAACRVKRRELPRAENAGHDRDQQTYVIKRVDEDFFDEN